MGSKAQDRDDEMRFLETLLEMHIDIACDQMMRTQEQLCPMIVLVKRTGELLVLRTAMPDGDEAREVFGLVLQAVCKVLDVRFVVMVTEAWTTSSEMAGAEQLKKEIASAGGVRNLRNKKEALIGMSCIADLNGPSIMREILRNTDGKVYGFGQKQKSFSITDNRLLIPWSNAQVDSRLQEIASHIVQTNFDETSQILH